MVGGAEKMAAVAEEIVHSRVKGQESLRLVARFEATHLAFLLSRRLVREFHSVVRISTRIVRRFGQELSGGDTVAAELVGEKAPRRFALSFQDLAKEALGSLGIPPTLHQKIEYGAVLVDSPPEIVDLSLDSDEHLVGVPVITELTFPALKAPLIARAEL